MKNVKVMILTIVFLMTLAMPAMAQGNSSSSKSSFESASFFGFDGTNETYVELSSNFDSKDSYSLFYHSYDFEKDEYYYGYAIVPASDAAIDIKKGTAKVNQSLEVYKVNVICDEQENCTVDETPAGTKSINLNWTFKTKNYSISKYTEKNVQIGYDEYIKLAKGTFKDYRDVSVTGTIDGEATGNFEYNGGSVYTSSSFVIIK